MLIAPDLFGDWILLAEWGLVGSGGRRKARLFKNEGFALLALQELTRRKIRGGYVARKD